MTKNSHKIWWYTFPFPGKYIPHLLNGETYPSHPCDSLMLGTRTTIYPVVGQDDIGTGLAMR